MVPCESLLLFPPGLQLGEHLLKQLSVLEVLRSAYVHVGIYVCMYVCMYVCEYVYEKVGMCTCVYVLFTINIIYCDCVH